MGSIKNITSSTPMPPDLARKIGVSGINEILDVFWKGYQELKKDSSFVVNSASEEDDITQKWAEKIISLWDSRNRATAITLNSLRPMHQYADNTMKKRRGQKPLLLISVLKTGRLAIATLEQKQRICIKIGQRKLNDTFLPGSKTIQPVVMVHSLLNPQ